MTADPSGPEPTTSRRSLRRRWNRWFCALALVSVAGGLVSVTLVGRLVDQLADATHESQREAAVLGDLALALSEQDGLAQRFVDDPVEFAEQFVVADRLTSSLLDLAEVQIDGAQQLISEIGSEWASMYTDLRPIAEDRELAAAFEQADTDQDPMKDRLIAGYGRQEVSIRALTEGVHADGRDGVASARALERDVLLVVAAASAIVALLILSLSRQLRRGVIQPIRELADAARAFGSGDHERRPDVQQDDELGELADTFTRMADALADSHVRLVERATHDPLTGLANRRSFDETLARVCTEPVQYGVLFIDLDDFKHVNDTMGHGAGDHLLQLVADRLTGAVRADDIVARVGGDEFAVILHAPVPTGIAMSVAARVLDEFERPFMLDGREASVSASIGVALRSTGDDDPGLLVREADAVMYLAKSRGKNRVELFDELAHAVLLQDPAQPVGSR